MAVLTISLQRTNTPNGITGTASIALKATGAVLESYTEDFPSGTAEGYVLNVLLGQVRAMMYALAAKQIPASFSFDIDSDQIRARRLFDL